MHSGDDRWCVIGAPLPNFQKNGRCLPGSRHCRCSGSDSTSALSRPGPDRCQPLAICQGLLCRSDSGPVRAVFARPQALGLRRPPSSDKAPAQPNQLTAVTGARDGLSASAVQKPNARCGWSRYRRSDNSVTPESIATSSSPLRIVDRVRDLDDDRRRTDQVVVARLFSRVALERNHVRVNCPEVTGARDEDAQMPQLVEADDSEASARALTPVDQGAYRIESASDQ